MQKLYCINCGSYLGRQDIPSDGCVEIYCASKTCKCHLRAETANGTIIFRVVQSEKAFQPFVSAAA